MEKNHKRLTALFVAGLALACASLAQATALTAERDTPARSGELVGLTVKASNTIYAGALVALDTAAGTVVPAADAAARVVLGRAQATAAAGEVVTVSRGVFRWSNGGVFTAAHIGQFAYVEDDATVTTAALASNDVIAGVIVDVDADGVWVDSYAVPAQAAATLAALTVTGNTAVGGTLAATGNTTLGGTAGITGNLAVNTDKFTVAAASGNTLVAGTLGVTGHSTVTTLTGSGLVKGSSLGISTGVLSRVAGTLVWIENSVTNVIDADVTTP